MKCNQAIKSLGFSQDIVSAIVKSQYIFIEFVPYSKLLIAPLVWGHLQLTLKAQHKSGINIFIKIVIHMSRIVNTLFNGAIKSLFEPIELRHMKNRMFFL